MCERRGPSTGEAPNPEALWPPSDKLIDLTATVEVLDNCQLATVVLACVTRGSAQPGNGV